MLLLIKQQIRSKRKPKRQNGKMVRASKKHRVGMLQKIQDFFDTACYNMKQMQIGMSKTPFCKVEYTEIYYAIVIICGIVLVKISRFAHAEMQK
ncbi:MAG: hypothetical protein RR075_00870 [Pygmaiobacter sp.]